MDRDAGAWQVVPATPAQIEAAARDARRMVGRRALLAAGVAIVPLPALDLATSVGVLVKLLPDINERFGTADAGGIYGSLPIATGAAKSRVCSDP